MEGPVGEGDSGGADTACHDLPLVRPGDADGTLCLRGDGSFWSDYKLAWHCGACHKLVLDTANCTRVEHPTSEEINRRIIYGADAEHSSESREEE